MRIPFFARCEETFVFISRTHNGWFSITTISMEFITTTSGGVKILLNGYSYIKHKPNKNEIRWHCCGRKLFDCPADYQYPIYALR